jgi:hypothetical protein
LLLNAPNFGKNPKTIIVKVAHKMVRAMLSVIKNEKPYQVNYSFQQTVTA